MFQASLPLENQFGLESFENQPDTTVSNRDNSSLPSAIQDNCLAESDNSKACGLRVRLRFPVEDHSLHNKVGTVIKVIDNQNFDVQLDDTNEVETIPINNITPISKYSSDPIEIDNNVVSNPSPTTTTPPSPKMITSLSLKELAPRTISVWNEIFQELLEDSHTGQTGQKNSQGFSVDINGSDYDLQDLEQWWMSPLNTMKRIYTIISKDDRLIYTGIFLICLSFFCYFILVTN